MRAPLGHHLELMAHPELSEDGRAGPQMGRPWMTEDPGHGKEVANPLHKKTNKQMLRKKKRQPLTSDLASGRP